MNIIRFNGKIYKIKYYNNNNQLHSLNGLPALILYYKYAGVGENIYYKRFAVYYQNGKRHRENNLPAQIEYFPNGDVYRELYYINGVITRNNDNLPCEIYYYENGNINTEIYYFNGVVARNDNNLPYEIEYYKNGVISNKLYRYYNISYYKNGVIKNEFFKQNNELHKKDGLTEITYYKSGKIKSKIYHIHINNKCILSVNGLFLIIKYNKDGTIKKEEYINNIYYRKPIITMKEIEHYINSTKPIKVRKIEKLKILLYEFNKRGLINKVEEIEKKLILNKLFNNN